MTPIRSNRRRNGTRLVVGSRAGVHLSDNNNAAPVAEVIQQQVGPPLVPISVKAESSCDNHLMEHTSLDVDVELFDSASDSDITIEPELKVDWDPNMPTREGGYEGNQST